ncbi:MAG: hypothetical protein V4805_01265 [Pseudomonadota bacterium]
MSTLANAILLQAAIPLDTRAVARDTTRFSAVVAGALKDMGMFSMRFVSMQSCAAAVQAIAHWVSGASQSHQQRRLTVAFAAR